MEQPIPKTNFAWFNRVYWVYFFFASFPSVTFAQFPNNSYLTSAHGFQDTSHNPSAFNLPENVAWSANILSIQTWITSDIARLSLIDITKINTNFLRQRILGISGTSTGWGGLEIEGPSLGFRVNEKMTIGFTSSSRILANYWDVNGRLVSEIGELTKEHQTYPYAIPLGRSMQLNTAVFSDIGTLINYKIINKSRHKLYAGAIIKLINGISHATIQVSDFQGTIKMANKDLTYITGATGQISTRTSGELLTEFNLKNLLLPRKISGGADLSLTYNYLDSHSKNTKLLLSIGIADLGHVRFKSDSALSKTYEVNIPDRDALFFNNNFNNASFARTTEVFDKYPAFFKNQDTFHKAYKVKLPSTLNFRIEYRTGTVFSISSFMNLSLIDKRKIDRMYNYSSFCISPIYYKKKLVISLPVSYQKTTGLRTGLTVRLGGIYCRSYNLSSLTLGKTRQLDLSIGYSLFP